MYIYIEIYIEIYIYDVLSDIYSDKKCSLKCFCQTLRWAWLSRGMASYEEMSEISPDQVSVEQLKEEMPACEAFAHEDFELHDSIDELLEKPDINRTTFLWQIESSLAGEDMEDWEKEDT